MDIQSKLVGYCKHILQLDLRKFKGRVFFVSDVHGNYDLLHQELRRVAFNGETDLLLSGGDWTDRGPHSRDVLDYLDCDWIKSIQANHEAMYIEGYESGWSNDNWAVKTLKNHGGDWIWTIDATHQKMIYEAFRCLPLAMELIMPHGRKIGIIHAEVPYNDWDRFKEITQAELDWDGRATAQWARSWYDVKYQGQVKGVDFVLCGHTPTDTRGVEKYGNMVFTDAGSFFSGQLNLIELNDEFVRGVK